MENIGDRAVVANVNECQLALTIVSLSCKSEWYYLKVNLCRMPDLLVGAPFYFTREDGGAVYIFMNKDHCLNCSKPLRLTGKPESRYNILAL